MSTTDHSELAPSAFHITTPCPASVQLQAMVPEQPDTEEIAEGKAAHHVAAVALASGVVPSVGARFELAGRTWTVDEDMHDGAALWLAEMGPGCNVETPVHIPRVHPKCWGTPDGWRYEPGERSNGHGREVWPAMLALGDYKYGHRWVDPFENFQLIGYASGVLHQLGISAADTETRVYLRIVQPRAFHKGGPAQTWETTPARIHELLGPVNRSAHEAVNAHPLAHTGGHCRDCKARAICGTLRQSAAGVVDFSGTIEPAALDTVAAATELRILHEARERLDARYVGLAAQVEAAARSGQQVPFWMLEPGRSKFDWSPDTTVDEVQGFGAMFGANLLKPPELITPTQAVKLMKVDEAVISNYATRKPGGVSLKPDDGVKARKIFGGA